MSSASRPGDFIVSWHWEVGQVSLWPVSEHRSGREEASDASASRARVHSGKAWGKGNRGVHKLHHHRSPAFSEAHMNVKGSYRGMNVTMYKEEDTV